MLVLGVREDEVICIGETIQVQITHSGGKLRVLIDAPKDIAITREKAVSAERKR